MRFRIERGIPLSSIRINENAPEQIHDHYSFSGAKKNSVYFRVLSTIGIKELLLFALFPNNDVSSFSIPIKPSTERRNASCGAFEIDGKISKWIVEYRWDIIGKPIPATFLWNVWLFISGKSRFRNLEDISLNSILAEGFLLCRVSRLGGSAEYSGDITIVAIDLLTVEGENE